MSRRSERAAAARQAADSAKAAQGRAARAETRRQASPVRVESSRGVSDVQRRTGGQPRIWAPSKRTDRS